MPDRAETSAELGDLTAPVAVWVEQHTGVVEITRPDKFNCLSTEVWRGLESALDRFEQDDAVRCMLLVSRGNMKLLPRHSIRMMRAKGWPHLANGASLILVPESARFTYPHPPARHKLRYIPQTNRAE